MTPLEKGFQTAAKRVQKIVAESGVPAYMHEGIVEYVLYGRRTGDFLRAVFSCDWPLAQAMADLSNRECMMRYISLLSHFPRGCGGTAGHVRAWRKRGGLKGITKEQALTATTVRAQRAAIRSHRTPKKKDAHESR